MKHKGILLVVTLAFACLVVGTTCRANSEELKPNKSTDMEGYRIDLGGKGYCIPKAYYRWSNSFNKTDDIGLDLSLEVSSFEAWSLYRNKSKKQGSSISTDHEIGIIVLDQTLSSRHKRWSTLLKASPRLATPDGYYRYEGANNPLVNLDYYLIPQKQADFSWVLGCVSGARCRLESQLDEKIFFELSFDERHLGQIKTLESRARDFLNRNSCK